MPYLEGSLPVYSTPPTGKKSVQIRFGGKKLPAADGKARITDFDKIQYIVNVEGREVLVGTQDGKWSSVGTEKDQIPLTNAQIDIVKELHDARDEHLNRDSKIVTFKNKFTKLFKDICNELNIDGSLHSLRHTFAVRRYLQTKDLYRVCKELGHTSILTTEIYAKFSFARLEQDFPSLSKVSKIRVLDTHNRDTHQSYSNVSRLWN